MKQMKHRSTNERAVNMLREIQRYQRAGVPYSINATCTNHGFGHHWHKELIPDLAKVKVTPELADEVVRKMNSRKMADKKAKKDSAASTTTRKEHEPRTVRTHAGRDMQPQLQFVDENDSVRMLIDLRNKIDCWLNERGYYGRD